MLDNRGQRQGGEERDMSGLSGKDTGTTTPETGRFFERRRNRRRRVLQRVLVISGNSTLNGTMQNISECGCKVRFAVPPVLPNTFEIFFPQDGARRKCELVWRSDREIGVRFTDAAPSSSRT